MTAGNGTIFSLLHRADATPPPHTIAAFQVQRTMLKLSVLVCDWPAEFRAVTDTT
jgi:hypothetical protein